MHKPHTSSSILIQLIFALPPIALVIAASMAGVISASIEHPPATGVPNLTAGICVEIQSEEDQLLRMEELIENNRKPELEAATQRLTLAKQNAAASGEPAEVVEAERELKRKERDLVVARTEEREALARSGEIAKAQSKLEDLQRQRDSKKPALDRAKEIRRRLEDDPEVRRIKGTITAIEESLAAGIGVHSRIEIGQLRRNLENPDYKGEENDSNAPRLYALHRSLEREAAQAFQDKVNVIRGQIEALRKDLLERVGNLERAQRDLVQAEQRARESLTEEQRKSLENKEFEQAQAAVDRASADLQQLKERGDAARAQQLKEQIAELEREIPIARQAVESARRNSAGPQKELQDAAAAFERVERRFKGAQLDLERQRKLVESLKTRKTELLNAVKQYITEGMNHGSSAHTENLNGNKQPCIRNLQQAREALEAAAALLRTSGCRDDGLDQAIQQGLKRVGAYECKGERLNPQPSNGLIKVPGVLNQDKDQAAQIIRSAGFNPVPIEYRKPPRPELANRVTGTNPAPGDSAKPGSNVTIFHNGEYTADESEGFKDLGPSTDKSATTTSSAAPSDPGNPHVKGVIGAIASCDFARARASLDQYDPGNPNDAWMAARYKEINEAQERVEAARGMLLEAQGLLQQPEPSPADIASAVALVHQARSTAPSCLTQIISRLTPALNGAVAAANQRERAQREQNRAATREALGTLVTGLAGVIAQARGGGAAVPPVSGGAGGGQTGAQSGDCGGCVISGMGSGLPVNYVFAMTRTINGCLATFYTILSMQPQTDDQGRPMNSVRREQEVALANAYGGKLCGPCGTYAQAQAVVRSRCPNPKAQNIVR